MIRFSPKETISSLLSNTSNLAIINGIFFTDDPDGKILVQMGLLIMTEVIRFFNLNKKNINDIGVDLTKMTSYVNRLLSV